MQVDTGCLVSHVLPSIHGWRCTRFSKGQPPLRYIPGEMDIEPPRSII